MLRALHKFPGLVAAFVIVVMTLRRCAEPPSCA